MDMKSTIGGHKEVLRGKEMYIMQNPPGKRKCRVNPSTFRFPPPSHTPQQLRTRLRSTLASLCAFTTEGVHYPDIKQAPLKGRPNARFEFLRVTRLRPTIGARVVFVE